MNKRYALCDVCKRYVGEHVDGNPVQTHIRCAMLATQYTRELIAEKRAQLDAIQTVRIPVFPHLKGWKGH